MTRETILSITSSIAPEEARTTAILGCKLGYVEFDVDNLLIHMCGCFVWI
jgi:hypothetical protein